MFYLVFCSFDFFFEFTSHQQQSKTKNTENYRGNVEKPQPFNKQTQTVRRRNYDICLLIYRLSSDANRASVCVCDRKRERLKELIQRVLG